ncbi:hypothetical protein COLO4_30390 [Corchorus olitorius]|uniref:Uncharacterized protein n=1 Tax=Corchorus olitorius TaxID=93759 RepID=A0A1R3H8X5_9ROSI|nr:hypothetical protein COLO4_30390 [Corchorus olitorius]
MEQIVFSIHQFISDESGQVKVSRKKIAVIKQCRDGGCWLCH